jgi:hypothetical protein
MTKETLMTTALQITTEGTAVHMDLSHNTLAQLQAAVGGFVQAVDLTPELTMWCNEEGKLRGLPFNAAATLAWATSFGKTDIIVGNAVFTGGTDDEGATKSLSPEMVERLLGLIKLSEMGELA